MLQPFKVNLFLSLKLPAAFLCGVRLRKIDSDQCLVSVRHRWINQNPFKSMYFAVMAMGAELTTGALLLNNIRMRNKQVSMLIVAQQGDFFKKATGKITFRCFQAQEAAHAVTDAIDTAESVSIWLTSQGIDQDGDVVCEFKFHWKVKLKIL